MRAETATMDRPDFRKLIRQKIKELRKAGKSKQAIELKKMLKNEQDHTEHR